MLHVPSSFGSRLPVVSATAERCASAVRRSSSDLVAETQPSHRFLRAPLLILATVATFVACASAGSTSRSQAPRASVPSTTLTEADVTRAGASTAYGTIERLRPWYLSLTRTRGATCERAVYVDRTRLGGLDALRGISSASVWQIRILDAPEATTRFGTGHCAGAIVVVTRPGR
jgi:hypothetical protein